MLFDTPVEDIKSKLQTVAGLESPRLVARAWKKILKQEHVSFPEQKRSSRCNIVAKVHDVSYYFPFRLLAYDKAPSLPVLRDEEEIRK